MAWWTKADGGKIEKHDGRGPKLAAMIRLNFARNLGGQPLDELGLYRRDPEKYPDEPNLLPEMIAVEERKKLVDQIRAIMGKKVKR